MNTPLFISFVGTSCLLAATPGPGVLYVTARTTAQGKWAGLVSVVGVAVGNLANAMAASFGLAALLASSSVAFTLVRFAGAAYLVYLGVQALRARPWAGVLPNFGAPHFGPIFRDGFSVALLNPKTALFFAALLPQFIEPDRPAAMQGVILSCVFVWIAVVTDSVYVLIASAVRAKLGSSGGTRKLGHYATAATFFGLAIFAAASGSRPSR